MEKYLPSHEALLAGGAGYKSLLVLDGEAEAYIHVTRIKVRTRGWSRDSAVQFSAGSQYSAVKMSRHPFV